MPNEIIHDLKSKLQHLAIALSQKNRDGERSIRGLERRLNLKPDSLKSAGRRDRWSLDHDVIAVIAEAGQFEPDAPWWIDPDVGVEQRRYTVKEGYRGRDTAENFKRNMRVGLGLDATVKLRLQPGQPQLLDSNLVTFEIFQGGQAVDEGEPLSLLASVVAPAVPGTNGVKVGFSSLRIRIMFKGAGLSSAAWLGRPRAKLGLAQIEMMGGELTPVWTLDQSPGVLNGDYTTQNEPLCEVRGAKPDDEFVGEVAFRQSEPGAILTITGSPVTAETEAILRILHEREIPGSTDTFGWKTLGRQTIRVGQK